MIDPNSLRKPTVTYHFSDLHEVFSGNHKIHTNVQLQYLHPPQISTCGKCDCVLIHQTIKYSEYIGFKYVIVSAQVTTVTYMHQSQPSLPLLLKNFRVLIKL